MSNKSPILTRKQLESFLDRLDKAKEIAIWLSASKSSSISPPIDCIGIGLGHPVTFCIPIHGACLEGDEEIEKEVIMSELEPYLEGISPKIIGHDLKQIVKAFQRHRIRLNRQVFDTKVASYLLEPNKNEFSIEAITKRFLDSQISKKDKPNGNKDNPVKEHCRGVIRNTVLITKLKDVLAKKLKEDELFDLFSRLEIPLINVLAQMELNGIKMDVSKLEELAREIRKRQKTKEKGIHDLAGQEFNPNSAKQVRHILFEKLDLPVIEKTKTGPSTNARVLKELSTKHPLPSEILKFRELSKLLNTYTEKLPEYVNSQTGRIHTTFNQSITATGRLSSSDPNLQNIPVRTKIGKSIRRAFVVPAEKKFLSADYSQIELRLLAHLSKDRELIKAFREDQDLHSLTAGEIFDVDQDQVDGWMRDVAKRVNFGIPYGISAFRLAKELGVNQEEAQEFIDRYYKRYPQVREFLDKLIAKAEKRGYATTILNRRRPLPNINSSNYNKRRYDQRNAINTPIQGSAADLIKLAMLEVHGKIEIGQLKADLLLQVHDELILEIDEDRVKPATETIKICMEGVMELEVPLKVDIKMGASWGEI